jgi:outer membrane lipoprotein-sorting protein
VASGYHSVQTSTPAPPGTMRTLTSLALSVLLAAPCSAAAQAAARPDAFAVLESAGKTYRVTSALCADFRQTLSVPLLGQNISGRGRLCSKQPGLFSMRFTEPAGDLYLADGTWLWMYTPSTDKKQVLRWRMAQGPRGVDFYREFLDAPRQKYRADYRGRETIDGKAAHRIQLTPLQAAPYRNADVWIDVTGALLRQVQIREENGSVRTITLAATDARTPPPAAAFTFAPPTGTQVITR